MNQIQNGNYYYDSHALQGITKTKGPTPASTLPVFYAWIAWINTVRKAEAAELNFSRGALIINTWVCWAVSATAHWHSRSVLEMYAWQCADAASRRDECGCACVSAHSCCHSNLVLTQNHIYLWMWKCVFKSFRNCIFWRLGVNFTMIKWKKDKIQGVNTREGWCHSCRNQI